MRIGFERYIYYTACKKGTFDFNQDRLNELNEYLCGEIIGDAGFMPLSMQDVYDLFNYDYSTNRYDEKIYVKDWNGNPQEVDLIDVVSDYLNDAIWEAVDQSDEIVIEGFEDCDTNATLLDE